MMITAAQQTSVKTTRCGTDHDHINLMKLTGFAALSTEVADIAVSKCVVSIHGRPEYDTALIRLSLHPTIMAL
jgi:hypothetical protein